MAKDTYSIVQSNMITNKDYTPYCGNVKPYYNSKASCNNPRTYWNGEQMQCPNCGWISKFTEEFIKEYKEKHNL